MALVRASADALPEACRSMIRALHCAVLGWPRRGDMTDPSPSAPRDGSVR
jgi:hypothetical protein